VGALPRPSAWACPLPSMHVHDLQVGRQRPLGLDKAGGADFFSPGKGEVNGEAGEAMLTLRHISR
jgi:hypothetical protein